jgi:hypothetical protein
MPGLIVLVTPVVSLKLSTFGATLFFQYHTAALAAISGFSKSSGFCSNGKPNASPAFL